MMVQEMLQVENVFNLQVLGEDKDTQLNLTWRTLDEKKNETDVCLGCGTFQLNDKVRGLVEKLVGEKPVVVVEKPIVDRKETGILYRDTPYSKWVEGGKKWFRLGDEKTQGKYEGEIVTGVPDGKGTITFPSGNKYEGEWKNGKYHGQGTYTWFSGNKYEGEYKDGKYHGQGTYTYPSGDKYVGEWRDGKKNGQGTFTYSIGYKYVGEYKDGKRHGQGTFTWSSGNKYVGGWKDGKEWNGTQYDIDGNISGKYVNGVRQ